ncbi:ExbD/TolR family protein [Fulvivirga sediminis]|uniref:Biopolymer transporter ExbD n=1 Tax=Fulvivirga sediminis TaxID=2803949 RepID=A0A937JZV8_9BACT|nr:biopolymer transporter ExbD [Fulvivirga sediminis]MBL3655705.1 biopolymer transporter ExbD [Fulvivirga sediminis]
MALKSKHQVEPMFSMSSMTDIIFLLLIFFMLTSSFITPSGLPVNLPSSKAANVEMQKVSITITKDLDYFVNDKKVSQSMVEVELKRQLVGNEGVVVLHIDETVPTKNLVEVAGIATALKAKVSIATRPN